MKKLNLATEERKIAAEKVKNIRQNFTLDEASEKLSIDKIYLSMAQNLTMRKKPRRDGSQGYFCPAWVIQRILRDIRE